MNKNNQLMKMMGRKKMKKINVKINQNLHIKDENQIYYIICGAKKRMKNFRLWYWNMVVIGIKFLKKFKVIIFFFYFIHKFFQVYLRKNFF